MSDFNSQSVCKPDGTDGTELCVKFSPPFQRSIGISNVAALCPAKIVEMGFVDHDEAE